MFITLLSENVLKNILKVSVFLKNNYTRNIIERFKFLLSTYNYYKKK